ncbi:uncharacterized protein BYT42DRAFT_564120 [Radiomyces spectabilis]|uniref:uncharacterized protein n=1 Tax=Radiomyces spectabilis TaxID=64574 RepID=UPI00221ED275|nr:uncharacterized protein BYT42DRAFT_564120 [Radiomyces spectabilis]KAI8384931.1 hypothetical protein BYT42DRAFT_564120 [Radiomyces spectabilis]
MAKKLSEIHRTATFAWGPGQQLPLLAAGTVAGALDDSFSNASELELFKLDLSGPQTGQGLEATGKVNSSSRFNTLAWGQASSDKPYGIIAGGMENGELALWDPSAILDNKGDAALISTNSMHTGSLRGLDFNWQQPNILASAGSNGEVYIWDLTSPKKPYTPGARSAKMDDITDVAWNCQVQHILATSSTTGHTVVWDLRNRKEVMTLTYSGQAGSGVSAGNRRGVTAISWHPDVATQLVTAAEDDNNPVITLWDLRHAHSPEKTLAGHTKGILGVSWCRQDSDLLMSCGKDCRTLCWNPRTGEMLGELSRSSNWTFEAEWCPRNPDLLASASFDGQINVYSLQGSSAEDTAAAEAEQQAANADDPFSAAILAAAPRAETFSLKQPPKWLRRPVGASFGFGGKLVTFNNKAGEIAAKAAATLPPGTAPAPQTVPRNVKMTAIVTDPEIVTRSEELEKAVAEERFDHLIDERCQQSASKKDNDDQESWQVLRTLFAEHAREQLMDHLGFKKEDVLAAVKAATGGQSETEVKKEEPSSAAAAAEPTESTIETAETEQKEAADEVSTHEETQEPTDEAADEVSTHEETQEPTDEAAESQDDTGKRGDALSGLFKSSDVTSPEEDFFVQTSQQSEQQQAAAAAEVREPLELYPSSSSDTDRSITRAIVTGDFESAVELCFNAERFSDALLLAICGGNDLLARTQKRYFEQQSKKTSYLRLLESIVNQDLASVVYSASLNDWTSVLAVLCTFARSDEFGSLCEILGTRLEEAWRSDKSKHADHLRHAILCYLAAGNLQKVSAIWIDEHEEENKAAKQKGMLDKSYSDSLQNLIEKVTVFRKAINFEDTALVEEKPSGEYELSALYDKYCEYAELLATQGKLSVALKYINLTPAVYRQIMADRLAITRDRIYHACNSQTESQYVQPVFPFEAQPLLSEFELQTANTYATGTAYETTQPAVQPTVQQQQQQQAPSQVYETYKPYQSAMAASTAPVQPMAPSYAPVSQSFPGVNNYQPQPAMSNASGYQGTADVNGTSQYGGYAPTAYGQPAPAAYDNYAAAGTYGAYGGGGYQVPQPAAPVAPPPASTVPPPPPKSSMPSAMHAPRSGSGHWNDPPMLASPSMVKSPKVSAATATKRVTSPFPNMPSANSFVAPPQQPYMQQPPVAATPPPPMNAVAPTPLARQQQQANPAYFAPSVPAKSPATPPPVQAPQARPPPPPMGQQQQQQQQHQQNVPSAPYAPNPYAPSPQQQHQQPPQGMAAPAPGPYAPQRPRFAGTPPPPSMAGPPQPGAPSHPMPQNHVSPPNAAPPAAAPPAPAPEPVKKRHPKDDRSHIPADQRPIHQILANEMQQARQRAAVSGCEVLDSVNGLTDHNFVGYSLTKRR